MEQGLFTVWCILLLDKEGKRLYCRYYGDHFKTLKRQRHFEKQLIDKVNSGEEIIEIQNSITCAKSFSDLHLFVTGNQDENELILYNVLQNFYTTLLLIFRNQIDKTILIENVDIVMLIFDEICDQGYILEMNPETIASRALIQDGNSQSNKSSFLQNFLNN
ncbi:coat protein (coatomer) zeta isoform a [Anaeramoeba ignava]|uniref:Coatomer subunit zeta n=1 Tax=Anaeramoeba ignava TaxID=1746090 RepID=A0A9Q0L8Z0_ANAIG|nr:coat protein (coatomer) zeta isoform a [Anaeramoeba ignava]